MSTPSTQPSDFEIPFAAVQSPLDAIIEEPRHKPSAEPLGSEIPLSVAIPSPVDTIVEEPRHKPRRGSVVYVVRHSFHQTLPGDINHAIATITQTPVSNNFSVYGSDDRSTFDEKTTASSSDLEDSRSDSEGRHNPTWTRYARKAMKSLVSSYRTNRIVIATAATIALLLPDVIFAVYAYYFNYADIFFNSRTAVSIYNNHQAESAFKLFFWVISGLASISHAIIGFGFAGLFYLTRKRTKMRYHKFLLWMTPPILFGILLTSVSFWIRPVVRDAYQAYVFNHRCRADEWDLDVVLTASAGDTLNNLMSLPLVGNASISYNSFPGINHDAQLLQHFDNPNRFDFLPLQSDDVFFPFTNVTFDWQNQTYSAIFPALHLYSYDPKIPFIQPVSFHACWPAAATLILRNSNSSHQQNVLRSLTHKPQNRMQLKLCAMSRPEISRELQISLGVVFINHFYYSTCVADGGAGSGGL